VCGQRLDRRGPEGKLLRVREAEAVLFLRPSFIVGG
jgi:hypothetical protein